jgi:hypothetical protein
VVVRSSIHEAQVLPRAEVSLVLRFAPFLKDIATPLSKHALESKHMYHSSSRCDQERFDTSCAMQFGYSDNSLIVMSKMRSS